jgi:hypothetical protein
MPLNLESHRMRRALPVLTLLCTLTIACAGTAFAQGKPHVHGAAQLDIAVETGRITLSLESPLDGLLGFEYAPRTDGEKRRAAGAVATLRAADALFRFPAAADCKLASVELVSAPLRLGKPEPGTPDDGHGDLDGSFVFNCADTSKATEVSVGLFDAFIRMQKLKVQVVTGKGQWKRELKRPEQRVPLVR